MLNMKISESPLPTRDPPPPRPTLLSRHRSAFEPKFNLISTLAVQSRKYCALYIYKLTYLLLIPNVQDWICFLEGCFEWMLKGLKLVPVNNISVMSGLLPKRGREKRRMVHTLKASCVLVTITINCNYNFVSGRFDMTISIDSIYNFFSKHCLAVTWGATLLCEH